MRAAVLHRSGDPSVLVVEDLPEPVPAAGQSLVDVTLAGLNYDDLEQRAGQVRSLPAVLGVDAVGRRRAGGRRVVALLRQGGGYAQVVAAEDRHTFEVPDHLSDEQALGLLEQGATAYGALVLAGRLRAGEPVGIAAAAGGVGHLAVQLAVAYGAHPVIGLASTPTKRAWVNELGADTALDPNAAELAGRLREASGGGLGLFLDSVGGGLARSALAALAPFGRLVSVGYRSGTEAGSIPLTTEELIDRSIGCAGFWMRHVVDDRQLLAGIAAELFALAKRGELTARIDRTVRLDQIDQAHAAMAARSTAGKVLIDVNSEG
jgi:NADPH2:quinone reductase